MDPEALLEEYLSKMYSFSKARLDSESNFVHFCCHGEEIHAENLFSTIEFQTRLQKAKFLEILDRNATVNYQNLNYTCRYNRSCDSKAPDSPTLLVDFSKLQQNNRIDFVRGMFFLL